MVVVQISEFAIRYLDDLEQSSADRPVPTEITELCQILLCLYVGMVMAMIGQPMLSRLLARRQSLRNTVRRLVGQRCTQA